MDSPSRSPSGEVESLFSKCIEAWLEACVDTPDTPRVVEDMEHRLPSCQTQLGVTDIQDVMGCHMKSDSITLQSIAEDTNSGYRHCTDAAGQPKVDGVLVMPNRGEIVSTLLSEFKAQSEDKHTSDWLPLQPLLTRAGIIAKPPDEPIRAKPVVVEPTSVSQLDNHDNTLLNIMNPSHLPDVAGPSRYLEGSSHRLIDNHTRLRRDVKGKLPMRTTQSVMTKCTPTILPIYMTVNRHHSGGHIDHEPIIRIKLNKMFEHMCQNQMW